MNSSVEIYSWGANSYGELGHGHTEDLLLPTLMSKFDQSVVVTGGGGHTFLYYRSKNRLLKNEDQVIKAFGWNNKGQLGLPVSDLYITLPAEVKSVKDLKITKIVCGWDYTLCLSDDGKLHSVGSNAFGQLGIGDKSLANKQNFIHEPQCVALTETVVDIEAGLRHAAAITESGKLFTWGAGKKGQLGIQLQKPLTKLCTPQEVSLPGQPTKVVTGAYHTGILMNDGSVVLMGDNKRGQMTQDPNVIPYIATPYAVPGSLFNNQKVIDLWSGWTHLLAKTEHGDVYSWGRNDYGQLGRATVSGYDPNPGIITDVKHPTDICCGSEHNLVLSCDNKVISWGWNEHGICGTGDEKHVLLPHKINTFTDKHAVAIGCGMGHSFVTCQVNIK